MIVFLHYVRMEAHSQWVAGLIAKTVGRPLAEWLLVDIRRQVAIRYGAKL